MNMQQPFLVPWVGLAAAPTAVAGTPTNGGAQSPTMASQYNTPTIQTQINGASAAPPGAPTTAHLQKMIALQQQQQACQQQQQQHQHNTAAAQAAAQIAAVNACLQPIGANSAAGVPQQTTQTQHPMAAQAQPHHHQTQHQQPSITPSVSAATANQIQAQINAAHQQYNAAALAANAAATQQAANVVTLSSICQPIGQTYPTSAVYQTAPMGQMSTIGAALSNAAAMGVNGLIPNVPAAFAAAAAAAANSQAVAQAAAVAGGNPYALGVSPHHPSMQKILIPATKVS